MRVCEQDVVSRQIALWEGQPSDQRGGPGSGRRLRGLCGPQARAYSPQSDHRRLVDRGETGPPAAAVLVCPIGRIELFVNKRV